MKLLSIKFFHWSTVCPKKCHNPSRQYLEWFILSVNLNLFPVKNYNYTIVIKQKGWNYLRLNQPLISWSLIVLAILLRSSRLNSHKLYIFCFLLIFYCYYIYTQPLLAMMLGRLWHQNNIYFLAFNKHWEINEKVMLFSRCPLWH